MKKTCLIIDDSRIVRQVIRRILQHHGFTCGEAENGKEALEFCKTNMPDLLIVDEIMPVMPGLDFLKNLSVLKKDRKTKIIFCSAHADIKFIESTLACGADEYIMKPFDSEILHSKLKILGLLNEKTSGDSICV